jgi:uncharacterized protein (DUF885 family)
MTRRPRWLLRAAVFLACGCGSATPSVPIGADPGHGEDAEARFRRGAEAFYRARLEAVPTWAAELGYHEYDGKLPDVSPEALAANAARLREALALFDAIPAAELAKQSWVEREVLRAEIRGALFAYEVERAHARNPLRYLFVFDLTAYISRDYAPLDVRARGVMGMCNAAGPFYAQADHNLDPELPRTWLQVGLLMTNGAVDFVRDDVKRQLAGVSADLAGPLAESLERCVIALTGYRDALVRRMPRATDDFALGEARFLQMLADKEGIEIDLARLQTLGEADLERNLRAMDAAARAVDPDRPTADVVAAVKAEKPAPDQVLAEASQQSSRMRQFLLDRSVVSIPSDHVAEVRESPPFMRWNSAFLSSPGPFEPKRLPAFYYISPPDPSWPEAERAAYIPSRGDLLFTSIHEVWPGHFLHGLHQQRNPSKILKTFCTYSMSEGWAHYTEEMMWDVGAAGADPKLHIGQLGDALLRNVRFLSAIGLHARGMTVAESITLFERKAFTDPGTARQQAVRGTFDAGYLNYTLGKLMILELRADWQEQQGKAYSLQAFHDELLSYGCAPLPVIRRAMLGADAGPAL